MTMNKGIALVPIEHIAQSIRVLRGQRTLLDSELAALYGVNTKRFNEQVKRNIDRFPADFMFQLTAEEAESLRSQFATLKPGRGQHRKYLPFTFTEHSPDLTSSLASRHHPDSADQPPSSFSRRLANSGPFPASSCLK